MSRNATPKGDGRHVRWPAEKFYWALLDATGLPAGEKITTERLRFLFEPELPEPLEAVHAVFSSIGPDRSTWVACAAPKPELTAEATDAAITLTPEDMPAFVRERAGDGFSAASLNLLVGEFEPAIVRSWRRRSIGLAVASLATALLLGLVGIERRIAAADHAVKNLRGRRDARIAEVLGPAAATSALPPELRLAAELRSLRQTRRVDEQVEATADATDVLAALLSCWPGELPTRTETIVVSDSSAHVRGTVAESDRAQELASATASLPGFRSSFPSIQSSPEGWRFGLEWRRDAGDQR